MTIADALADFHEDMAWAKRLEHYARARFGRALREEQEAGASLRNLAQKTGYSHAQIDNFIKGNYS